MKRLIYISSFFLFSFIFIQLSCTKVVDPPNGNGSPTRVGCPFTHVEVDDTTREYIFWSGAKQFFCKELLNVRFIPITSDSVAVATAQSYGLTLLRHAPGSLDYVFQTPHGKRAEEYYTPYGKSGKQNFGNEPIVQVAFAISYSGTVGYTDELSVQFDSTVSDSKIDSINALYNVQIKGTHFIGDKLWHTLRVTKESPYSCFDMANLYHCFEEVLQSAANISTFFVTISPCT